MVGFCDVEPHLLGSDSNSFPPTLGRSRSSDLGLMVPVTHCQPSEFYSAIGNRWPLSPMTHGLYSIDAIEINNS